MANYVLDTGGGGDSATSKTWNFGDLFTAEYWKKVFADIANHPSTWGALGAAQSGGQSGVNILGNIEQAQVAGGADTHGGLALGNDADAIQQENPVDLSGDSNNFETTIENSASASDARTYGNIQGSNVEEQLMWLIQNDPENAQGWMEQLIGLRGERENVNDARAYEKLMSDTRIQRTAKDLEAAGINPILAYQYLSGSGSSVAAAGFPDSNVSTNATSRQNNKMSKDSTNARTAVAIVTALIAMVGIVAKAAL